MPQTVHAHVTLTVEVAVRDSWGEDCSISQVHRQASESAMGHLSKCLTDCKAVRIVGEAKVTAVIVEREGR